MTYDEQFGVTRTLTNHAGQLTLGAPGRDPLDVALSYVQANPALLGISAEDLADYEMTDLVANPATGSIHVYFRQMLQGLPVYNGQLHVNVDRESRIMSVNNQFVPALAASLNAVVPSVSAATAVARAAEHLGIALAETPAIVDEAAGIDRVTRIDPAGVSREPITARLMLLPVRLGAVRLVWNFQIHTTDQAHAYDLTVDAETGAVWTRFDWGASMPEQYYVYPRPIESPNHAPTPSPSDGRSLQVTPADPTASPFGWHDTNGAPGPEFTIMRGNNVHAYHDRDDDGAPPPSQYETDCGPYVACNFQLRLNVDPVYNIPAGLANLFYWNNIIHDIQYQYGFTEAAGNFQVNNYGRGGLGNDDLRAEAQDGADRGKRNRAFMVTPPDGHRPRMGLYIYDKTTPNRDTALDNWIILHEHGHGVSIRQVGGPSNSGCLNNRQQMGEGLSDWWGLVYTAQPGDVGSTGRGLGTYLLGQPTTGLGHFSQRFSTNPAVNDWTYESINGMQVPHGVGSVWTQATWEMYWALVDQHGFDPNLYNATGSAGNQRAMLYVNEGLQNAVCSPTFTDMRDAIIQAAASAHGGQDVCLLWTAFAGMGLGVDAVSGGPNSTAPTNGFRVPTACVPIPEVSIGDVSMAEGNSNGQAAFTVSLSATSPNTVWVDYTTADATATNGLQANPTPIIIPTSGEATPYPAPITVASSLGTVTKVTATLHGFGHTFPSDVDVLLVGPGGQSTILMSDVGGGTDVSNLSITFDDAGPAVPGTLVSGTFRPTDLETGDNFPSPAPSGAHGSSLSVFNGVDPVGTWRLFVVDDTGIDGGQITDGWSLTFSPSAGPDYTATTGALMFPPGTTSRTVTVPIIGDTAPEPNETFQVNLSNPIRLTILDGRGIGTIVNDDGAPPTPTPTPLRDDVAVDFGPAGLWALNNGTAWGQLHVRNPTHVASGDVDGNGVADVVADLPGIGIWVRMNNTVWAPVHPASAAAIAVGDLDGTGQADILIDFPGFGVWVYANNSTWSQLHSASPTRMVTGDLDGDGYDEAILDFPGLGIWVNNRGAWARLHPLNAGPMMTVDLDGNGLAEVVIDFPGFGIWIHWNASTWSQLHSQSPTRMAAGDLDGNGSAEAIFDFPGVGIWVWNTGAWSRLHTLAGLELGTGDLDGNGQDDVLISFPGIGLWAWMNDATYTSLHPQNPESLEAGNYDGL